MLAHPATGYLHNPDAYWCADCWKFTLDCSHLVEPLTSPEMKLDNFQSSAATWQRNVLQVTMNTGERYQFFRVPRWLAVLFVRNPQRDLLKGYRFERVRLSRRIALAGVLLDSPLKQRNEQRYHEPECQSHDCAGTYSAPKHLLFAGRHFNLQKGMRIP